MGDRASEAKRRYYAFRLATVVGSVNRSGARVHRLAGPAADST
jgi:hypothetical protein